MAFPLDPIIKIVLGGAMAGDQWTVGFYVVTTAGASVPTATQMNTYSAAVLAAFNTATWGSGGGNLRALNSTGTTLASCKTYYYTNGGLVTQGTASITPVAGTGTAPHPAYVACCVTTQTGQAGRSHRGRMYLPATAWPVDGASLQFSTSPAGVLSALSSFLNTVKTTAVAGSTYVPTVVSSTHGYQTPMNGIRADSIPDTQHGRENKFIATVVASQAV